MITVEALLFAALGFLLAGVLTVLLAPLYWARAVRLTTREIEASMPLSENQIAADRGLLKAEHAITVSALENRLAQLTTASATARVDVNRRDARIAELEKQLKDYEAEFAANENARRVLERTVMDRVPDVERHLRDARERLADRDDELAQLRHQATKTFRALDEAMQISEQQRGDIVRLKEQLAAAQAQAQEQGMRHNAGEIVELQARNRAQASLIEQLRHQASPSGGLGVGDFAKASGQFPDIALADLGAGVGAGNGEANDAGDAQAKELAALKAKIEDRDREIGSLRLDLETLEKQSDENWLGRDPKARRRRTTDMRTLTAAHKLAADQEATIQRLRSELAAANGRLARQAAHFQDEFRRLGGDPRQRPGARRAGWTPNRRVVDAIEEQREAAEPGQSGRGLQNGNKVGGVAAALAASGQPKNAKPANGVTSNGPMPKEIEAKDAGAQAGSANDRPLAAVGATNDAGGPERRPGAKLKEASAIQSRSGVVHRKDGAEPSSKEVLAVLSRGAPVRPADQDKPIGSGNAVDPGKLMTPGNSAKPLHELPASASQTGQGTGPEPAATAAFAKAEPFGAKQDGKRSGAPSSSAEPAVSEGARTDQIGATGIVAGGDTGARDKSGPRDRLGQPPGHRKPSQSGKPIVAGAKSSPGKAPEAGQSSEIGAKQPVRLVVPGRETEPAIGADRETVTSVAPGAAVEPSISKGPISKSQGTVSAAVDATKLNGAEPDDTSDEADPKVLPSAPSASEARSAVDQSQDPASNGVGDTSEPKQPGAKASEQQGKRRGLLARISDLEKSGQS